MRLQSYIFRLASHKKAFVTNFGHLVQKCALYWAPSMW